MCTLSSCDDTPAAESLTPVAPTISVPIIRWEEELTDADQVRDLRREHPAFSEVYLRQIMALPNDSTIIRTEVERMLTDTGYQQLLLDVRDAYPDLDAVQPRISQTVENYMNLFDLDGAVPRLYTFASGFVYQSFLFNDFGKDGIGLGLDMFLGADFPYQKIDPSNVVFSSYLSRTYDESHIPRKIAQVLVEDQLPPPNKTDFLSMMIWGGKRLYLIDQILTFESDTIVTEYTQAQLDWCEKNELEIWEYFFDRNLFYETDMKVYGKLIAPAPSSPGMPPESPGATANYMGWQIVKAYMQRYPKTSLKELIALDAQTLLDRSKYKPGRR